MNSTNLTFPDERSILSFLSTHQFTQNSDIQTLNIVSITAQCFANQVIEPGNLKKTVIKMLNDKKVKPLNCGLENYLFIQSIMSALQECVEACNAYGMRLLKRKRIS
jgi:hypothetical protein